MINNLMTTSHSEAGLPRFGKRYVVPDFHRDGFHDCAYVDGLMKLNGYKPDQFATKSAMRLVDGSADPNGCVVDLVVHTGDDANKKGPVYVTKDGDSFSVRYGDNSGYSDNEPTVLTKQQFFDQVLYRKLV